MLIRFQPGTLSSVGVDDEWSRVQSNEAPGQDQSVEAKLV